jgi:hypothetical protein
MSPCILCGPIRRGIEVAGRALGIIPSKIDDGIKKQMPKIEKDVIAATVQLCKFQPIEATLTPLIRAYADKSDDATLAPVIRADADQAEAVAAIATSICAAIPHTFVKRYQNGQGTGPTETRIVATPSGRSVTVIGYTVES